MDAATAARLRAWALQAHAKELVRHAAHALGPDARIMPLKGTLLGALGFVHPAERPMRDVDLLVDGLSERRAVERLSRAGFVISDLPWAPGYLSMAHPQHGNLWLDLHTRTVPIGLGRIPRSYMFVDAHIDEATFGVPVHVPSRLRLAVQLLANVVKDRVVHALSSSARDLAAVLADRTEADIEELACELVRVSLSRASALAAAWAHSLTQSPALDLLAHELAGTSTARAALDQKLEAMRTSDHGDVLTRIRARAGADSRALRALSLLALGASAVAWPLRRALLGSRG